MIFIYKSLEIELNSRSFYEKNIHFGINYNLFWIRSWKMLLEKYKGHVVIKLIGMEL
jgi:hypothetical protein